jgi:hypothetical protein
MKRTTVLAILGWASLAAAARAAPVLQAEDYPGQGAVTRAEVKAKAAAGPCERELKGGKSAAACGAYHDAVLLALEAEHKRFLWCQPKMTESTNIPVPTACFAVPIDMRFDVIDLERKVAPKTWKAFDDKMARFSN